MAFKTAISRTSNVFASMLTEFKAAFYNKPRHSQQRNVLACPKDLQLLCDAHEAILDCSDIHVRMMFNERGDITSCSFESLERSDTSSSADSSTLSAASFDVTLYSPTRSSLTAVSRSPTPSPVSVWKGQTHSGRILKATDFKPIKLLGQGGQGSVYHVEDQVTNARMSLKVISKSAMPLWSYPRFFNEQFLMKKLAGFSQTLPLLGSFHDSENFYFLTEYIPNGDLFEMVDNYEKLSPSVALHYSSQLVYALYTLHGNRILHRDVKLENLLVDGDDNLVLADFGLAEVFGQPNATQPWKALEWDSDDDDFDDDFYDDESGDTMSNQEDVLKELCGSRGYMAPEMYFEKRYSYPADIWAAGICLYVMLTGRLPFEMNMDQTTEELLRRSSSLPLEFKERDDVDEDAQDLLEWMLEKDPAKRATIEDVMSHAYFDSIDWTKVGRTRKLGRESGEDRASGLNDDTLIAFGKPLSAEDDPFPWFTWVSPDLQAMTTCG